MENIEQPQNNLPRILNVGSVEDQSQPSQPGPTVETIPDREPTTEVPSTTEVSTGDNQYKYETATPSDDNQNTESPSPEEDNPKVTYFELPVLSDSTTVQQDYPIFVKTKEGEWSDDKETLVLPPENKERLNSYVSSLPNVDYTGDLKSIEWIESIRESDRYLMRGNFMAGALKRDGAKFRQAVMFKDKPLMLSSPKFSDNDISQLTGIHAVIRMRAQMGLGSVMYVPLWHSGFWICMRAPSEQALLDLFQAIEMNKIRLGRETYGLAFANSSVFYANEIFNFMLEHLFECTLKDSSPENLSKMILVPDLHAIAHALACSIHPKGFQYARPVLDAGGKERKIIRDIIDVKKIMWEDTSQLTDRQVAHMSSRTSAHMTNEMVENYRADFIHHKPVSKTLSKDGTIGMTFKVPSCEEYFSAGQMWVDGIVRLTEKVFNNDISETERNNRILNYAKATNFRQYGHWVKSIDMANGSSFTQRETLNLLLDELSGQDDISDVYFTSVRNFIDDATITLVAVPAYDKAEMESTQFRRFPNLVPIDPMSTFFTLLAQKVRRITERL